MTYKWTKQQLFEKIFVWWGFNIRFGVVFSERLNNAFAAEKLAFFAPLKKISKNRILEIDILRSVAILLIVLYHVPSLYVFDTSATLSAVATPVDLLGFVGLSLFFFVSGFSLYLSNKTIRNRRDALRFYKKRALRIYPLYWLFVAGIVILHRPSFAETAIYVAGLQALFYPTLISTPIYHFVTVILIFYLLFPLIVFFDDYRKLLFVAFVALLVLATMKLLFGFSDSMFLVYYGLFVGGIIAGKSDVYNKMRQANIEHYFVFTIPLLVALMSLWLFCIEQYFNSTVLAALLNNLIGIATVLVMLFWTIVYVKVFDSKLYALFTFVAFSTYGVFFINAPFLALLGTTLNFRFGIAGTAATMILVAFIPFLVVAGYLLQFITNEVISVLKSSRKR